jgi:hypothetical protein
MGYLTLYARADRWQILGGIGDTAQPVGERGDPPSPADFAAGLTPHLWMCGSNRGESHWFVERLRLPDLVIEEQSDLDGRVGAMAVAPDGERIVVLRRPAGEPPSIWLRSKNGSKNEWKALGAAAPDLSSRLAWIDSTRIAYETRERRLGVIDVETGATAIGPAGHWPQAAQRTDRWYAIRGGRPVAFRIADRDLARPEPIDGFTFGRVTSMYVTHDGEAITWTEPRLIFGVKTYVQQRARRWQRLRRLEDGLVAVMGPYEL